MKKHKKLRGQTSDQKTQQRKDVLVNSIQTMDAFTTQAKDEISQRVNDGFTNFLSRLGVNPDMDNQLSGSFYTLNMLSRNRLQLEAAYRGSWVVGVIVDAIAEDMTRAGITITTNEGAEDVQNFQAGLKRLQVWNALCDLIKWARLYGGGCGIIMISGQNLSTPLRIETVGKGQFTGIAVYDRWQLYPSLDEVISEGPDMGLPAYYYIITSNTLMEAAKGTNQGSALGSGIKVHHSRVVRQIGVKLPFYQAITEMMWGMSEIERVHDRLVAFDGTTMSAANLVNHAHLRTVQVDKLREILAQGGKAEEGLIKMFEYMRLLQSNEGITLIDKEDTFATTAYTFAGLSDVLLQFGQQLSGASGIPLVRFFGQSPAGLNSTGESDMRNYYDKINAQQEAKLRTPMDKIIRVAWQSLFGRPCPNDMEFTFTSLWQMTPLDKATIGRTKAETIAGAHEAGLLSRPSAVKELRALSAETGLFSNITDEEIEEAEQDDVPLPGDTELPVIDSGKAMDAIINRLKKLVSIK